MEQLPMHNGQTDRNAACKESLLGPHNSSSELDDDGRKGITFFGGFCLIFNNACGAGVAAIPYIFCASGWAASIAMMAFFWIISSITSVWICDVLRKTPRNHDGSLVELTGCAKHYIGTRGHAIAHVFLFLSLQSLCIASIIISAQALDQMCVHIFGYTCGAGMIDNKLGFSCVEHTKHNSPFSSDDVVLSTGFFAAAVLAVPLGMWNLDENIWVQIVCMYLTFACILSWLYSMFTSSNIEFEHVPFSMPDWSQLCGTMLYNFAYVVTIPSWYNERRPGVSVRRSVWLSSTACFLTYAAIGLLGASAYAGRLSPSVDFLAALNHDGLSPAAVYFFPIMAALSGVPIFSIIIRYNLLEGGTMNERNANLISTCLPWTIAMVFQTGSGLQQILNLSSLLFSSVINYLVPLACIYIFQCRSKISSDAKRTATCICAADASVLTVLMILFVSITLAVAVYEVC
eukprot:gnl/TRDRNA2_/TRDRNA2_161295_c1_seq4.p1 gnl/TRDRNA2_/TRDRNA2_161295_c1~~gnl/TRDRNA2_/TRDRNA2_161295_c1_seq4.p1  ORF type:complete len:459 (+),score=59.56 gnl/TRDRNA2_/TRDRNA2_161295_c1_seq4:96-1472(+)